MKTGREGRPDYVEDSTKDIKGTLRNFVPVSHARLTMRITILSAINDKKAPNQSIVRKVRSDRHSVSPTAKRPVGQRTNADDLAISLEDLVIWREQSQSQKDPSNDADNEDGALHATIIGTLTDQSGSGMVTGLGTFRVKIKAASMLPKTNQTRAATEMAFHVVHLLRSSVNRRAESGHGLVVDQRLRPDGKT